MVLCCINHGPVKDAKRILIALNNRNFTFNLKVIRKSTTRNKYKFYWVHIKYIILFVIKNILKIYYMLLNLKYRIEQTYLHRQLTFCNMLIVTS